MSLLGKGALALWHHVAADVRREFHEWHGREHFPDRLAIPGFLRARRFAALDGTAAYVNLYETAEAETLVGRDYVARASAPPSPRTLAVGKHFAQVIRWVCRVVGSEGEGQGGLLSTFRYSVEPGRAEAHRARMVHEELPRLAAAPGVAGCHLLFADPGLAASVDRPEGDPEWALFLEGWGDADELAARCEEALAGLSPHVGPTSRPVLWRLQASRDARPPRGE